jgi:hypothetical protein
MTYARARLWLGISGVGTFVVLATSLLVSRIHLTILPNSEYWQDNDAWALVGFVGAFLLLMLPFDLLGGFILPNRYQRQITTFGQFLGAWLIGVALQSALFVTTGLVMLSAGRVAGTIGVTALIAILSLS